MDLLRERRKEIGLTQKQLADYIGCSESTISQYECGKRRPDYETLLKLAEILHLSASELLGDAGAKNLSPYQRKMLDAINGLSEDDINLLIRIANRLQMK